MKVVAVQTEGNDIKNVSTNVYFRVLNLYSYLYSYINMPYYPSNQLVNSLLK